MWKWEKGRQNGEYNKFLILKSEWLKFDFYLLHFPKGSEVPKHRDKVDLKYKHHRINIFIKKSKQDGDIYEEHKNKIKKVGRFQYFRPDIVFHWMDKTSEDQYILSFGWLTTHRVSLSPDT